MSVVEVREAVSEAVRGIFADPAITEDLRELGVSAVQSLYAIEAMDRQGRALMFGRACEQLHALGHAAPRKRTHVFLELRRRLVQVLKARPLEAAPTAAPHLDVTVNHESHSNLFTGISGDIVDGGVFVATGAPLPVGTQVSLKVSLPAGKLISQGRVSFVQAESSNGSPRPGGMGIRLTSPGLLQQEPVMKLLAHREPFVEP